MPFFETALIGDDNAENQMHYAGIRLRIVGEGELDVNAYGLDDTLLQELSPLKMSLTPGKQLNMLSNFRADRIRLRVYTDKINETFNISRIVLFTKESYKSYPQ